MIMMQHRLPSYCYDRLVPPPWVWENRLTTPDQEEEKYAPAIRARLDRAYAGLTRVEGMLWRGRVIPFQSSDSDQVQGFLTSIYYAMGRHINFGLSNDPYNPRTCQVVSCAYLDQLESVLRRMQLPIPSASQLSLFAPELLKSLERSAHDYEQADLERVPLTRDLYYPDQLTILPRIAW
jgi:hypothetical protein